MLLTCTNTMAEKWSPVLAFADGYTTVLYLITSPHKSDFRVLTSSCDKDVDHTILLSKKCSTENKMKFPRPFLMS